MFKKLLQNKPLLSGILITVSMLFATFSFYAYQIFFTPNVQVEKNELYLLIPTGATYQTVVDSLKKNKVVDDVLSFSFLAKVMGYQQKVLPGRYLVRKDMTNSALLNLLRSGRQTPVKLVFGSVRLKEQIAGKVCRQIETDSAVFNKLLNSPETYKKYGFNEETIAAMFIPNTYEVYWNISAEELLDRFNKEYQDFWNEERRRKAEKIGFTPVQVSVLASIVGSETNKADEKPRIAGVYINRMNSPETAYKLQADPTVIFALRDFSIKRVTKTHLQVDSPYNTYKNRGLPPGPINTPSITSIDAVLNYEKNDYLFFVVKADFSGYHTFTNDYNEHLKNARLYWEALNLRNIK
ncbi:MAG: endolytic transglycosylase MltG [Verrucomicrobia bacterium]|nr:endolytic transglycosylase MltG [Cytophagales bacterium]